VLASPLLGHLSVQNKTLLRVSERAQLIFHGQFISRHDLEGAVLLQKVNN
jgi:hypothetical protein